MKKKRRLLQSDTFWGVAAAMLILLQFWWLPGEDGSTADSYSATVDGKLGLYKTLSALFPKVERDSLRVVPRESATVILVAPDRYPNQQEQQELYEFVYNGGDLLFAPNWMSVSWSGLEDVETPRVIMTSLGIDLEYRPGSGVVVPSPGTPATPKATTVPVNANTDSTSQSQASEVVSDSSVVADPASPPSGENDPASGTPAVAGAPAAPPGAVPATTAEEKALGDEVRATSPLVDEPVDFLSTAKINLPSNFTAEPLLTSDDGNVEAATWVLGYGRVVVCSSADLFSNRSMLYKGSRRLAVRLVEKCAANTEEELEPAESSIVINEYFNASDSFQSTGILLSPTLRIGTLQLLLVAVLGIWMAFHRFGPAQDVTTVHRRSLSESAQAVGNLQYRLNDGGAVVRSYLDYMSSQMRRRYGSFLRLDQADQLANRSGMDVEEVRTNLREAQIMAESSQLSPAKAAGMLRWLARLQQRLAGNRS